MEKHGVTFKDYACAVANLAAGMEVSKICGILGIEEPQYYEIEEYWNNKTWTDKENDIFGEVFTNPKQGKFANVEGAASGPEEVMKKFPEWTDYLKMEKYMEHAPNVGLDIDFDKEFGITITQYSQLAEHWSTFFKEKVIDKVDGDAEAARVFALHDELREKWDVFYKEKYKDLSINISDDIDF